ncbi:DUF4037 domain-containing protein [Saccharothrix luteola]|uniref:DUF4037 domain-containing protein n=1 Tax=Saccharothrix luteola TaxID=2893018 RepID=UPI001E60343E|nr:DUF4037 domain-containing protein [Saccharothrix luteola]MCC8243568.1 DUF4037 domain-containing protein [Saccharothrix luteola]
MADGRFMPGLVLAERFYREAVEPLVRKHFGEVPHSAARLGAGSEVLGFDTERSADHEWGPRLQLFLDPDDTRADDIGAALAEHLPKVFLGFPTHFVGTEDEGVGRMALTDGPVRHRVDVTDAATWFDRRLGFDPRGGVTVRDWLGAPTQRLAETTAGAVFHDGLGVLTPAREALRWYPDDVWRHVLACQWARIAEGEAFVGRCGEVGDELGSAVVAARLTRDLMRLRLLLDRRYPPYDKWLGSAFARYADLVPVLRAAVAATDWRAREDHLAVAYERIAERCNDLGLADPVDPTTRPYHDRPFRVLRADRFTTALRAAITDPEVACLPLLGAVDQCADSTAVLEHPARSRKLVD